ncbi:hypothetical protein [Owenweeksia hongkongensis]|uniref:hypothetical protein n=1 Tax=Owenweeksia hongkongensis TaxID=253245 RepID=UPI003A930FC8
MRQRIFDAKPSKETSYLGVTAINFDFIWATSNIFIKQWLVPYKLTNMIKALSLIFTILGAISLVVGIIGIFGQSLVNISPWALAIIGVIFFSSGIGLLKKNS